MSIIFFLSEYVPKGIFYLLVKNSKKIFSKFQLLLSMLFHIVLLYSLIEVGPVSFAITIEGRQPLPPRYNI